MIIVFLTGRSSAQTIEYSEPDRDDARNINFAIVGKINDHILILKNYRSDYNITVLDNDMKMVDKVKLTFLPDRVSNVDVLAYKSYFYIFYQYQKRNIIYCMGAKFDGNGKLVNDPVQLDTTTINVFNSNKIYTVTNSEDKQKILIFKINSKNQDNYAVTTVLFDGALNKINKTVIHVPMPDRNDFLTEFQVSNDGNIVFARAAGSNQNENISKLQFITKAPADETASFYDIDIPKIYLDDIRVKINNANKHYLITSFYSKTKRGNIDGLFCSLWDGVQEKELYSVSTPFTDDFRSNAKTQGGIKSALNDFFLQDIVMRKDGGYAIVAESEYSSSRGGGYNNRWDYMYGSPYFAPSDYYSYGSPFGSYYPWGRPGYYNNQIVRFYADNIAVMSFDSTAKLEWANVIPKSQYDDNTDNFIGYGTLNTGGEVHFLFNELEKRTLILTDQSVTPDGQIHRNPTLHNLDRGFDFMPKHAKQVGSHELIVPCQYRNYVCYAKVDLD